mmetsp:Transcript_676/g.2445  ORF Transcript_676/g.2445 Transcript_676/m.2445 type:complete len:203 (+) Transcript_676:521-1129(+)
MRLDTFLLPQAIEQAHVEEEEPRAEGGVRDSLRLFAASIERHPSSSSSSSFIFLRLLRFKVRLDTADAVELEMRPHLGLRHAVASASLVAALAERAERVHRLVPVPPAAEPAPRAATHAPRERHRPFALDSHGVHVAQVGSRLPQLVPVQRRARRAHHAAGAQLTLRRLHRLSARRRRTRRRRSSDDGDCRSSGCRRLLLVL